MKKDLKRKGFDIEYPSMRLNRFIAVCGVCSRRKADLLIKSGRVSVNGAPPSGISALVVPDSDEVRVDGNLVSPKQKVFLIMNKPRGVVSAASDRHSMTVLDILPEEQRYPGLFPVGRLDKDSEGLLLLTNDGDLAQQIIHPRNGILKTYEVMMDGAVTRAVLDSLCEGTVIGKRMVSPSEVRLLQRDPEDQWIEITLSEGLKREIRVMAESRGLRVISLVRRKIGQLELQHLQSGSSLAVGREQLMDMILHGGTV